MRRKIRALFFLLISSVLSASGWGQQFKFQRQVNTIQVYASEYLVNDPFAGGIRRSHPAFADIDGDGDSDLFVGEASGHIHFFRNHRSGDSTRFELVDQRFLLIDTESYSAPAFVDIDADGDLDLFIGNGRGDIIFFLNTGSTTGPAFAFQTTSYVVFNGKNSAPWFVDIDDDGDLDLFVGEEAGNINFYQNIGTAQSPGFALQSEQFSGIQIASHSVPILADIDGDSDFDLIVGQQNGTIGYFKNKGTKALPAFEKQKGDFGLSDYGSFSNPSFFDIDSDGDPDFFVGEQSGNVNFVENIGTTEEANFVMRTEHFTTLDFGRWSAPAFADIDNDADFDLFVGESDGEIKFLRNTGTGTKPVFTQETTNFLQSDFSENIIPAFADIDNDGDFDLFVGQCAGNISFFRNTGNAIEHHFVLESDSLVADIGENSFPALADIDNDGDLDLFAGEEGGKIFFFRNQGDGVNFSFILDSTLFAGIDVGSVSSPVFADIDQDGDLDLIVGENNGNLNFLRNTGTPGVPSFSDEQDEFGDIDVGRVSKPAFIDIDSDGDLDIFVGEEEGGIYFYLNETLYTNVREIFSHRSGKPDEYLLAQNYPNPFNPTTVIRYQLSHNTHVQVSVFNILGQRVAELVDRFQTAGYYSVRWDGRDGMGRELPAGIYYYRLQTPAFSQVKKLTLLR